MHAYLSAIGFSGISSNRAINCVVEEVVERYDRKTIFHSEDGRLMAEYAKLFAKNCGVGVCGELDDIGDFHPEYYFPFYQGREVSVSEEVTLECQTFREAYEGALDDNRVNITLIFFLTNMGEYRSLMDRSAVYPGKKPVIFSAPAMDGTVILPVRKNENLEKIRRRDELQRKKLVNAARDGDEDAIESLTMADLDTYSAISQRLVREDILSIVESYIMPCGVECDQYNILGTIQRIEMTRNIVTGDRLYQLVVECNDILISVCINTRDLLGVPEVGRRFKGRVWLQGQVLFQETLR